MPHCCSIPTAHNSHVVSSVARCPTDRGGHLSLAPPSPIPPLSASACRPTYNMLPRPPNPHSRPVASYAKADSSSSSLREHCPLPVAETLHTAPPSPHVYRSKMNPDRLGEADVRPHLPSGSPWGARRPAPAPSTDLAIGPIPSSHNPVDAP